MNKTTLRCFSSILSLSLLLSTVAPAAPAFAADFQATPARVAPTILPIRSMSFVYSPTGELPAATAQVPGTSILPTALPTTVETANTDPSVTSDVALPLPLAAAIEAPAAQGQTDLVMPTAMSAQGQANAPAKQSWTSRLKLAVNGELSWGQVFDFSNHTSATSFPSMAMGIRPLSVPNLPAGIKLDPPPSAPDPRKVKGVTINEFSGVPDAKPAGGVFDAGPRLLKADPKSAADVERAIRELIDLDAAKYGVTSSELQTVHASFVEGKAHQTDTIYVLFHQTRSSKNPDGSVESVPVHGARMSFTVKIVNGNPVLFSSMGQLYPNIAVNTTRILSDDQLKEQAEKRLGIPPNSPYELQFVERKIIFSQGAWHAANLYTITGYPVMIAVDVSNGEAFAWDPRMGFDADTAKSKEAVATILGRGEKSDTRPNGQPDLVPLPMKNLTITMADGSEVVTDKDGKLVVTSKDGKEVAFSAALEGTFARVVDSQGRTLKINGTLKPGTEGEFVYNPKDAEEWVYNLINTFQGINRVHDWLYERFPDKRINRAIPGTANIDQECNAYYSPGNPSLNFFHSSANCSDTGRPGIIAHEYGHFWDDMIGGIVNGGLSEGWGDILSMFIFGSPIIGDGFLKNTSDALPATFLLKLGVNASTLNNWADSARKVPLVGRTVADLLRPSYIRNGENTYQYNENDEVHQVGEAWMGFAWKLRKSLIAKLGEAAGAALAESLIIPTMLAKAGDVPAAMAQVLLADMGKNGLMPHEAEIRAAAKVHGIDLPKSPGLIMTLVNKTTGPLKAMAVRESVSTPLAAVPAMPPLKSGLVPEAAEQTPAAAPAAVRAKLTFSAGALIRGQVRNEIAKYCDYHGLKYTLKEYKSWLSSDFLLTVEGPQAQVQFLLDQLHRISAQN